MNKIQEDILNLHESVDGVLQSNNSIWTANVPFATTVSDFEDGIDDINEIRDRQETDITGLTEDKDQKRTTLEARAYQIGSVTAFYASRTNKRELFKKVDFSITDLR